MPDNWRADLALYHGGREMKPTPSMLVALIALGVALSGSATAALVVTGRQVKDGTISRADLAPAIRAKLDRLPSSPATERIPTVVQGPQGQPGQPGQPGSPGASGASGAEGPPGDTGTPGANGSARAYVAVNADGTLGASHNILSVTAAVGSGGAIYCVIVGGGIDVATSAPVVSVVTPYPQSASAYVASIRPGTPFCPSDPRLVEVETKSADAAGVWSLAPLGFRVVLP